MKCDQANIHKLVRNTGRCQSSHTSSGKARVAPAVPRLFLLAARGNAGESEPVDIIMCLIDWGALINTTNNSSSSNTTNNNNSIELLKPAYSRHTLVRAATADNSPPTCNREQTKSFHVKLGNTTATTGSTSLLPYNNVNEASMNTTTLTGSSIQLRAARLNQQTQLAVLNQPCLTSQPPTAHTLPDGGNAPRAQGTPSNKHTLLLRLAAPVDT